MCTARRYYFLCTGRGRQTFQSLCCRVVCCPVASHNGGRATTWQYHSSGQVQNSASVGRLLHGIQEHPAMMPNRQRVRPNILITGTPGVGKTTMASTLADKIPHMRHLCVGDVVKSHKCYEGMDFTFDSYILDEEKLLNAMEIMVEQAAKECLGLIVDFHSCDFFPERWFDLVLVLRADTEVLFDRLVLRGYSEKKRTENVECEIMQVVLDEARESYAPEIVHEIPSNTTQDMVSNINRIEQWCQQWIVDNTT